MQKDAISGYFFKNSNGSTTRPERQGERIGQKDGFIKRQFGWLQNISHRWEGLARARFGHDLRVSVQRLDKRFTEGAGRFMKSVLERAACEIIAARSAVDIELLSRFMAVYIADCSTVELPMELRGLWQGRVSVNS